jgi:hypothetical protein
MRIKPILLVTAGALVLTTVTAIAVVGTQDAPSTQTSPINPLTKRPPQAAPDA